MCGIVGYYGTKDAIPILINGISGWSIEVTIQLGLL